ncbi:MAG: helix-turn-helix transcriptional regulator [Gammaproteobacteria bacterium]|nr:helix-turn-helix transcriptional regulator [Gammaproteobacteria bacterium]
MSLKKKKISARGPGAYRKLEDVVGCKWSVSVLLSIGAGVNRPGGLERHIDGISTKVLSERLRKLTSYGLLEKKSFPEVPPRTEYSLTSSGRDLVRIIQQIQALDSELDEKRSG